MGILAQRYHCNRAYHGFSEVEAATKDWLRSWEWFRIELEELVDAGERLSR
jgi:hypothetical protein